MSKFTTTGNGIEIFNSKDWARWLKEIDISDRKLRRRVVAMMKHPFKPIFKDAKRNLIAQGSSKTGRLLESFAVRQQYKSRKGVLSVAFGGKAIEKSKHYIKVKRIRGLKATARAKRIPKPKKRGGTYFYPVNAGTGPRKNKKGANRGVIGHGNSNTNWQKGFADRAILRHLSAMGDDLVKGFRKLTEEITEKANRAS